VTGAGTAGSAAPVAAIVLAAGAGTRLRPLTGELPKALCPVGNVPLLDRALDRLAALGFTGPEHVAVNACYLGDQVVRHVGDRAHLSVESGAPLGTAGGVANLRHWLGGRGALVGNADGYLASRDASPGADIAALIDGWDGRTVRLLGQLIVGPPERGAFSGYRFAGFSLLPWHYLARLAVRPAELVTEVWRPAEAAGELVVVPFSGTYLDTGTPADYLAANLHAAGGGNLIDPTATVTGGCVASVVGAGAVVRGRIVRSVLWPGAVVGPDERLTGVIRTDRGVTVQAT
jgi:MurNAc alpha-1-phosphate uridylyltransferase